MEQITGNIPQSDEVEAYGLMLRLMDVDLVAIAKSTLDEERRIGFGMLRLLLDDVRENYHTCVAIARLSGMDEVEQELTASDTHE